MLKSLYEAILGTAKPTIREEDGHTYIVNNGGTFTEILPTPIYPDTITLHSLDALVKMIKNEACPTADKKLYVHVPDHMTVTAFYEPDKEIDCRRFAPYTVKATDVPGWDEKVTMGFEEAQIALRTRFQATNDTGYALQLLSTITTGGKVVFNDNGIATTVTTQKGISLQQNEAIRPLITLKPYRTFQEVEQPESLFLIRINERGIGFTVADGGMWKLKARETVKEFLEAALADEVREGSVVIAL